MICWRAVSLLCNILDGELVGPHDLPDLLQSFGALSLDQLLILSLGFDASLSRFESFQSFVQLALDLNFNGDQSSSQLGLEGLRHNATFQSLSKGTENLAQRDPNDHTGEKIDPEQEVFGFFHGFFFIHHGMEYTGFGRIGN